MRARRRGRILLELKLSAVNVERREDRCPAYRVIWSQGLSSFSGQPDGGSVPNFRAGLRPDLVRRGLPCPKSPGPQGPRA